MAAHVGAPLIEVEVVCSDTDEHQRRVAARTTDIPGLMVPLWEAILHLDYQPWDPPHLVVDNAKLSPSEAVAYLIETLS